MNQFYTKTTHSIKNPSLSPDLLSNFSLKLTKLNYLLQNYKIKTISKLSPELSKDLPLYLSLTEKPINLLFSMDQFFFEFSKKTYQQKKTGEFFQQLKERKKLTLFYGHLNRKYIVNLFNIARKKKGSFSKNFLCLLERRLDVVLYRSGMVSTIAEARQLILHKKIFVNENLVNYPAFLLDPGDMISMASKTTDDLKEKLVKSIKIKLKKNHLPSIYHPDFYSKLKKTLDLDKSFKKISIHHRFKSNLICNLLIELLCSRIKWRSFYYLANNLLLDSKTSLILFKWKSFSDSDKAIEFRKSLSLKKGSFDRMKTSPLNLLYINEEFLQKKPVANITSQMKLFGSHWNQNLKNSKIQNKLFLKNSKTVQFQFDKSVSITSNKNQRYKKNYKSLSFLKKNIVRNSFLVFLKYLDNYKKFTGLVKLKMKKPLYRDFYYKQKSSFIKNWTFRTVKPLHVEVSYKLLNVIYLYSPQRLNFPFSIDLDRINRSIS